jgi:hypothetical protein
VAGVFRFHAAITNPLPGLIVSHTGWFRPAAG